MRAATPTAHGPGSQVWKETNYPKYVPWDSSSQPQPPAFLQIEDVGSVPFLGKWGASQSQDPGPSLGVMLPQTARTRDLFLARGQAHTHDSTVWGWTSWVWRPQWRPAPHREAEIPARHPKSGTSHPPLGPRQKPAELSSSGAPPDHFLSPSTEPSRQAPRPPDRRVGPRDEAGPFPPQQRLQQFRNSNSQTENKRFRDQRATLRRRWKGLQCASPGHRQVRRGRRSAPESRLHCPR